MQILTSSSFILGAIASLPAAMANSLGEGNCVKELHFPDAFKGPNNKALGDVCLTQKTVDNLKAHGIDINQSLGAIQDFIQADLDGLEKRGYGDPWCVDCINVCKHGPGADVADPNYWCLMHCTATDPYPCAN
ncbi:hypothetical protein F4778DRAFT_779984 [Xylariomycetidae sp. FL2044]|nr:hypothetical protein F4778DRAFT_788684 [Xylariomycetidae sp. FL2044]KAH9904806.1 hypothetical protein F4778DRAFT_779984 [Xylariomycetidae sp. FL2044]